MKLTNPRKASRAFLGMSHSPLMGLNPVRPEVERALHAAIDEARAQVHAFDPELVVLVAPDHYNGFFNELMPPFCLGTQAHSVGDYLTPAGDLNVDADMALALITAEAAALPVLLAPLRLDSAALAPLEASLAMLPARALAGDDAGSGATA